jgi:hypothetical protein
MVPTKIEFDEYIKGLLNRLHRVTPLNPQAVAEERAKFLAQGELFRATVSQPYNRRHIGWINTFVLAFQRKERKPMLNALMAVVISITVLFGGAGATVYAAQGSLPDQPLYQVKTLSEDFRLALAGSAQGQLDLNLEFADRRVAEVVKLQAADKAIPEGVTARLQEELNAALQIAAGMDDPQMIQALTQIRQQAEVQAQIMAAVMNAGSNQGNSVLARIQERLQEQVRLAAAGEADPQGFRIQVRDRDRVNRPTQTPHPTQPGSANHTPAPTGTSYGPGPGAGQPTGTPGHYGPGEPNPSQTPEPTGGSYGPGPGTGQPTGTPGHYGPGEPNPSQTPEPTGGSYGPGPGAGQPSETPGGYGPGPQAGTATCTPAHDGGGPGPGPLNPSATPQAGDPGAGNGQATVTPQQGGNSEGGQPTEDPGYGGGQP